jgi:ElaB/YqjD/DUF883 family membrane-anchored ribosome-binding protein
MKLKIFHPAIVCSLGLVAGTAFTGAAMAEESTVARKTEVGAHKAGEAVKKAGEKTGEAMAKAGKKTGEALDKAGKKTGEALDKADEHVKKAAKATKKKAHELHEKVAEKAD